MFVQSIDIPDRDPYNIAALQRHIPCCKRPGSHPICYSGVAATTAQTAKWLKVIKRDGERDSAAEKM